jgi:copper chaperone CopZ
MRTMVLDVSGITCDHCAQSIERAVAMVDGVNDAVADTMSGTVRVNLEEDKCDVPQLIDAVRRAGFQVSGFKPAG